ncbi:MAG: hypothetical protein MHPSP_001692, partial [Paramarteilia canceri]
VEKYVQFGKYIAVGAIGEDGHGEDFVNFLLSNFNLHKLSDRKEMTVSALAHFARTLLMERLRSR